MVSSRYERKLIKKVEREYDTEGAKGLRGPGSLKVDNLFLFPLSSPRTVTTILEVKKTQKPTRWHFSEREREQFWDYQEWVDLGYEVAWAIRHTRGSRDNRWRFFRQREMDEPKTLVRYKGMTFKEYFDQLLAGEFDQHG